MEEEIVELIIETVVGHLPKNTDEYILLDAWVKFLEENLSFPFTATYKKVYPSETLKESNLLKVIRLETFEMSHGILMNIKLNRKTFIVPIEELVVTDKRSKNYLYFEAYKEWFPQLG